MASTTRADLWPALARIESRPAPAWRWQQLLGEPPHVMPFLRRVPLLADRVPCPHPCGCGQLHRVLQIAPSEFMAIPDADDCEAAPVLRAELAVFAADTPRIAASIAATGSAAGDAPPPWLLAEAPAPPLAPSPSRALGGRTAFSRGNTWPHARPDRPTWADVSMTIQLQEVHIRFGQSQGSFDYRDIDGFTDRRGGKRPNRLWHLLRAFAMKAGTLPLPAKAEDPVRVRTLADLERVLRRFFALEPNGFVRNPEQRTVSTRFGINIRL